MSTSLSLEQIADKHSSEKKLIDAIRNLGPVKEPADFWIKISNDNSYSKFHRRHCIFQLFYRHIQPGMSLSSLATIFNKPHCLHENDIYVIEDLGGHIPVSISAGDTILVINVLPENDTDYFQVYFKVSGEMSAKDFYQLLNGQLVNPLVKQSKIIEMGFNPVVIDSIGKK